MQSKYYFLGLYGVERFFHQADGVSFGGFGDVDVRLHGFVVGVTGELHHHIRRNSVGKGKADKGLAARMGAYQGILE